MLNKKEQHLNSKGDGECGYVALSTFFFINDWTWTLVRIPKFEKEPIYEDLHIFSRYPIYLCHPLLG